METEPMLLEPARLRWPLILFGVITIGVGAFFIAEPHETLKVLAVIAGIFLLIDGCLALIGAIAGVGDSRGLLAVLGVLSIIAGLILIKKPSGSLIVFTLILGVWFVVAGAARLVAAFSMEGSRGAYILTAVVDLIAGIVILSWPGLGLATLAVIIGILLVLRGILFIVGGFALRRLAA